MNAPDRPPSAWMPGLDRLRALAALAVLFGHGGYFLFALWPHYDLFAGAAWLGTDAFFALTGFLLARQLLATPPREVGQVQTFLLGRAVRILPLFWTALLVHAVLARIDAGSWPASLTSLIVLTQNLAQPPPAFFAEAWNLPLLAGFSLVLPWLVHAASRAPRLAPRLALLLVGALLLGLVVRGAWVTSLNLAWDEGVRKVVLARLDACTYGALAACLISMRPPAASVRRLAGWLAGVVLLLAVAGFALLARDASDVARIGLFVPTGIGFSLACVAWSRIDGRPASGPVRWLARRSYALYLTNMPMLLLMMQLGFGQGSSPWRALALFAAWLVLALGAAEALHRWVERPLLASRARSVSAAASSTSR